MTMGQSMMNLNIVSLWKRGGLDLTWLEPIIPNVTVYWEVVSIKHMLEKTTESLWFTFNIVKLQSDVNEA